MIISSCTIATCELTNCNSSEEAIVNSSRCLFHKTVDSCFSHLSTYNRLACRFLSLNLPIINPTF